MGFPRKGRFIPAAVACLALAACGGSGRSDGTVSADLQSLLLQNGIGYQAVNLCTHQSGNQYICKVTMDDQSTEFAQVTDDGHSISEIGIAK